MRRSVLTGKRPRPGRRARQLDVRLSSLHALARRRPQSPTLVACAKATAVALVFRLPSLYPIPMPLYEFLCTKCGATEEVFTRSVQAEVHFPDCPKAGKEQGHQMRRIVSKFAQHKTVADQLVEAEAKWGKEVEAGDGPRAGHRQVRPPLRQPGKEPACRGRHVGSRFERNAATLPPRYFAPAYLSDRMALSEMWLVARCCLSPPCPGGRACLLPRSSKSPDSISTG